jgi:hypothetical protein
VIIAANTPKLKLFAQARAASSTFTTHTFFHVAQAPADRHVVQLGPLLDRARSESAITAIRGGYARCSFPAGRRRPINTRQAGRMASHGVDSSAEGRARGVARLLTHYTTYIVSCERHPAA